MKETQLREGKETNMALTNTVGEFNPKGHNERRSRARWRMVKEAERGAELSS